MLLWAATLVAFLLPALAQDQFMMVFGGVPQSRDVYEGRSGEEYNHAVDRWFLN